MAGSAFCQHVVDLVHKSFGQKKPKRLAASHASPAPREIIREIQCKFLAPARRDGDSQKKLSPAVRGN